jgi:hypothetical protein
VTDRTPDVPLDDVEEIEFVRELGGDRPLDAQLPYFPADEVIEPVEPMTDTERYEGEPDLPGSPLDGLELLEELDLRADETDDPNVASEEGLAYVPPIDPPVVADREYPEGVEIAAGFGTSALDEPYDDDHRSGELSAETDLAARIHEALRADASTSRWEDQIIVGTRGGLVVLRGVVDDVDDSDDVVAVVERVEGVEEVIDEIEVTALG